MELVALKGRGGRRSFVRFQQGLYAGDGSYVCTGGFLLRELLERSTPFARACGGEPVAVREGGRTLAQAILICHPGLPYLQVSFFDGLPGQQRAVDLLLETAQLRAKALGCQGVVVGLNGHISYGVGILSSGFAYKNSFDSLYTKPYYPAYFSGLEKKTLSTYRGGLEEAAAKLPPAGRGLQVERARLRDFYQETERMRELCERTIGTTFLYYPTQPGHFYHLMKDLRPFLRDENLLFAKNGRGEDVGFLFWHPDFNQALPAGREVPVWGIGLSCLLGRGKLSTAKLNAMGALCPGAVSALLGAFAQIARGRYRDVETNFVWDNNGPSTRLNRHLLGEAHRTYEVYFLKNG